MSAASIGNIHIGLYVDIGDQRRFTQVANLVERDSRRMNTALGHTSRSVGLLRTQMSHNLRLKLGAESLRTLSRATDDINRMRAALMGLAAVTGTGLTGALSAAYLLQTADKARLLSNQLKTVTNSTADLNAVQDELFAVSQRTRSSFEATTTIYARTARATETLGTSQEKLLRITETVQKAFAIGGASSAEATGAAIQLSQGIASDRLGGEEFRSVAENAPVLLRGIADSLGVNIGKLREMAHEGELTAKIVTEAIIKASARIDAEFGKTAATVSQGVTMLDNAFLKYVGSSDETYGVTRNLAGALQSLAENFEDVMYWVTRAGAAIAALYAARAVTRKGQGIVGGITANNQAIREEMAALVEQNKEITARREEIADEIAKQRSSVESAENGARFDQAGKIHAAREKEYALQQSLRGLEEKRAGAVERLMQHQNASVANLRREVESGRELVRANALRVVQAQEAAAAEERNLRARLAQKVAVAGENVSNKQNNVASANAQVRRSEMRLDQERAKAEYDAQVKYDEARARKLADIDSRRQKLVAAQMRLRDTQSEISDLRGIQSTEGFNQTFGKQYRGLLAEQQKALIGTDKLRREISGLEGDLGKIEQQASSSRGLTAAMNANERAVLAARSAVDELAKAEAARAKIAATPIAGKSLSARLSDETKQLATYEKSISNLQTKMRDLSQATSSAFSGKAASRMVAEIDALDQKIASASRSLSEASVSLAAVQEGDSKSLTTALQAQARASQVINDLEKEAGALIQKTEVNTTRLAAAQKRLNVLRRAGSQILDFFGGGWGLVITGALVAATAAMSSFAARAAESAEQTSRITKQLENLGYLAQQSADSAEDLKNSLAQGKMSKLIKENQDFQKEIDKSSEMLKDMDLSSTKIYDNFAYPDFTGQNAEDPLDAMTKYEIAREAAASEVGKKLSLIRDEMVKTKGMTEEARKSLEDMALANPELATIIMSLTHMGEMMNALGKASKDWVQSIKDAAAAANKAAPSFRALEIKSMSDLKDMDAANQPMLDEMTRANNRTEWESRLKAEQDKIIAEAEKLGHTISIGAAKVQAEANLVADISKKGLKDLISHYEGTGEGTRGYNETLDRGKWTGGERNLVQMTLREILSMQDQMRTPENRALYGEGKGSSAVGKYMIVGSTLRGLMKELGLSGDELFDQNMQERLADAIVRSTGGDITKLRGQWAGLNKAPDNAIATASGVTMQSLPAMDESTKQWIEGLKDLNLQSQIKALNEFDQSVLQQAQSMGISTDEMQKYIAAVQSGNLEAIPDKFRQIAAAMQSGVDNEFVQKLKELQSSNLVGFLSDVDQEVVQLAESMGMTSAEIGGFVQAVLNGQMDAVGSKFEMLRDHVQELANDKHLIEFADGLGTAVGGIFSDMKNGENVFDNLIDRLADLAVEMLVTQPIIESLQGSFRNLFSTAGSGGGGGGLFSWIGNLLGGGGGSDPWAGMRGYATGTASARRGLHVVGENGIEVVDFKGGEQVHSNDAVTRAMKMMKGGGAAGMMQGAIPMPSFRSTAAFGKLQSPPDVSHAVRSSEGLAISVAADIDKSGNIIPLVTDISQKEGQRATSKGINEYNKTMPDRIKSHNQNPRKR